MPVANAAPSPTISVEEADSLIRSHVALAGVERCALPACAGRVLREEIRADRDFPPFDRVTMDGIALSFAAFERGRREFAIEGVHPAGAPQRELADPESCIEVMTGATLPAGCDCVIPVEQLTRREQSVLVDPDVKVERLQFVHRRGSDHRAGDLLLEPGRRLRSPEIAICATVGKSEVAVSRRARVAVVTTGDELVEVDREPEPHQIRGSNSRAIAAALSGCGDGSAERFHARDDRAELESLFAELLDNFDLLVVSGGVSAGRFDLVPGVLEELGVRKLFHRVAQRPGYPLYFGLSKEGKAVFALPGNPVSALVSTHRYIIPFLRACAGCSGQHREYAVLSARYEFAPERTLFLPVALEPLEDGRLSARPMPTNTSGDLAALAASDGFVELPAEQSLFEAGTSWPCYRWR